MAVTDLTGTKWQFAEDFYTDDSINDTFNIEFTTNGENFSELSLTRISFAGQDPGEFTIQIYISYGGNSVYSYESEGGSTATHSWTNDNYRTIEITGGTDATNADLIAWLQANATQIEDESNPISIGNLPIADMYFGTQQVKKVYLGNTLLYEKEEPQPTVDPILTNNSWGVIKAVCEAGKASDYWSVGDTKTDVGTDGVTRKFRIADMQGLYGKHVVFEQVELESTDYRWNPSSNVDGENCYNNYSISDMRMTHLPLILTKYSSALQSAITPTRYKVATNGNNGTLLELEDKLFLPAEREIFGSRTYSRTEEWNALTRFQLYASNDTTAFRKKFKPGATSATTWWLRSPRSGNAIGASGVGSGGYADSNYAYDSYGVSPFFSF